MSTLKKVLALTLALAMILSVSAFAGSYKADTYKDAASIDKDCEDSIELLYALDIMQGDAQGNFRPNDTITRAEVAKMIYVIKNYGKDDKAVTYQDAKIFSDVPATAWYAGYVNYCGVTKLIQGRGNGTFGPTDPVTTAAAAKMLLTAIGYDAEARGYVGANWDKNVLSDAAIVGLLDDYNYSTIGAAPRQWVAVMFQNALLNAYTYKTMVASPYNGLITSTTGKNDIVTFGEKYYDMTVKTLYLYATHEAYIDKALDDDGNVIKDSDKKEILYAASGKVRFSNGLELKNTGLGVADLGQQYKVIYADGKALSVRATGKSVVAESRVQDITVDIDYKVSDNKAYNKYIFNVEDAKFSIGEDYTNTLSIAPKANEGECKFVAFVTDTAAKKNVLAKGIYDGVKEAQNLPTTVKFIDKDGDGKLDYMIYTVYEYGIVVDAAKSDKYGEYVAIAKADATPTYEKSDYLTYSNKSNLYLDDCIISDTELEEGNIVKYTWDVEEEKFDVEVLGTTEDAAFENRNINKGLYQLDGEEYVVAANGWKTQSEKYLNAAKADKKDTLSFVADGDLLVYVWSKDDSYTEIADVNAQLVLVLDAGDKYSQGYIHDTNGIKYMTIDGDVETAEYMNKEKFVQFNQIFGNGKDAQGADIAGYIADMSNENNYVGRLFILHKSGSKVYLEKLDDSTINTQLHASTALLDGYTATTGKLDATKDTVKFGITTKIAEDNLFFAGYKNSDGDIEYKVMALSKLAGGSDEDAYVQFLTLANSSNTRFTAVAGYAYFDLENDTKSGYLYVTDTGRWDNDKVSVVFADGTEAEITLKGGNDGILENVLYSYSYRVLDDEYVLTLVGKGNTYTVHEAENIIAFENGEEVITKWQDRISTTVLDKETIAVVTFEIDRDGEATDTDPMQFSVSDKGISFVKLADLTEDQIINAQDDRTYTQYTDYVYVEDDVFYVIVYNVMNAAQEVKDFNADALYDIVAAANFGA